MRSFLAITFAAFLFSSVAHAESLTLFGVTDCPTSWQKIYQGYVPHSATKNISYLYSSGGGTFVDEYRFSTVCSKTATKGAAGNYSATYGIRCAVCIPDVAAGGTP